MMLGNVVASGSPIGIGDAAITAVLGYIVVFVGLFALMAVTIAMSKVVVSSKAKKAAAPAAPVVEVVPAAEPEGTPAPGSAGKLKLYDTPDRDAAMIMAIVAHRLGKPLNELRFISIKEVK